MKLLYSAFFAALAVNSQYVGATTKLRGGPAHRALEEEEPVCVNDAVFGGVDDGCDENFPRCYMLSGYEAGYLAAGEQCGKCLNEYDSNTVVDSGCSAATPLCDADLGKVGTACVAATGGGGPDLPPTPCTNNAAYPTEDDGCSGASPFCALANGEQPGANAAGEVCGVCMNEYDSNTATDPGCSEATPRCDADLGKVGAVCLASEVTTTSPCTNDSPFAGVDTGCSAATPICAVATQDEPGFMAGGVLCAKCFNEYETNDIDPGCSAETPRCQAPTAKVGMNCLPPLISDTLEPTASPTVTPPFCKNTKVTYNEVDQGCSLALPVCATSDDEEPGYLAGGDQCGKCLNQYDTNDLDPGCSVETPRCDADLGKIGLSCLPPMVVLTSSPTSSPTVTPPFCKNTKVSYTEADQGCTAALPVCATDGDDEPGFMAGGDKCGKCLNVYETNDVDPGCSVESPRCNADLGKVGSTCDLPMVIVTSSPTSAPTVTPPFCKNTQVSYTTADQGCTAALPVCATDDDDEPGYLAGGEKCGKCLNQFETNDVDPGCSVATPRCNADLGKVGTTCDASTTPTAFCTNSQVWGGQDQGCALANPICYAEDATAAPNSQKEAPYLAAGTACARCTNTYTNAFHTAGVSDPGCPSTHRRCAMLDGANPTSGSVGFKCCKGTGNTNCLA